MESAKPSTAPSTRLYVVGGQEPIRPVRVARPRDARRARGQPPRYDARHRGPAGERTFARAERDAEHRPPSLPRPAAPPPPRRSVLLPIARDAALGAALAVTVLPAVALVGWRTGAPYPLLLVVAVVTAMLAAPLVPDPRPEPGSPAGQPRSRPGGLLAALARPPRWRSTLPDDDWRSIGDHRLAYAAYRRTSDWQRRRRSMLRRAGARCQVCNAHCPLEVHHRTYERLGRERPEDLIVLCRACHSLFHAHGKLDRR